ncbi:MAG: ROK family protein [Clostridiaceae bacterium]
MDKILVLDVGGSAIKIAVIQENEIIFRDKVVTPRGSLEEFTKTLDQIVYKIKPNGIALSMPGIIDSKTGMMRHGGALTFIKNFNMKELLEERYHMRVEIENDGKSAALGELYKGKLQGCENGVVIVIGSGIGGGIIINGKLYKGHHFSAGEFSSIRTNDEKAEGFQSIWAMKGGSVGFVKRVKKAKGIEVNFEGSDLFQLIEEKDEVAIEAFINYCRGIAVQIVNLQAILDPEKFIIGGGISVQKILIEKIQEFATQINIIAEGIYTPEIIVEQSDLGNDANIYGAYYNYLQEARV